MYSVFGRLLALVGIEAYDGPHSILKERVFEGETS